MNVPSYAFLGFAALVAVVSIISDALLWRRAITLIANILFILSFTQDPKQLAPFTAFLLLGYASIKLLETNKRKAAFATLLGAIVFAFCLLKRYAFIPHPLFLPFAYMTVGISYVFFRIAHLIVDAFEGTLPGGPMNLLAYLGYTLYFPCVVSGPIQLYPEYLQNETHASAPLSAQAVGRALERIVTGFFKAAVLSPLLLSMQNSRIDAFFSAHTNAERITNASLILALFPFYLYMNFSGYTDFVIGVARFLKAELPENFNDPFSAKGFIDFWGRWHMTLSTWFKTYVYSPMLMGLIRRFPSPNVQPALGVFVYFVTFFLVGVWHGQTMMFLFYGILQGLGVSVNKVYQIQMSAKLGRARYRELCAHPIYSSLSRGLTFSWFSFTLLWFWASPEQLVHFAALLGPASSGAAIALMIGAATVLLGAWESVKERLATKSDSPPFIPSYALRAAWCALLLGITLSVTVILNAPAPHIVYKAF